MKRFIFVASSILFLSTSLFSCSNKDSNVFYDFDIQVIGEGNVTGTKPGKYELGTEITLTCSTIQNSNYEFDGFYKDDTLIFSGLTYTFTLVDDTYLTARFVEKEDDDSELDDINNIVTNDIYSHTFKKGELSNSGGSTGNINGLIWNYDSMTYAGFDNGDRGFQIGSAKNPQLEPRTISTDLPKGVYVTGFSVVLCNASQGSANYSIKIGNYTESNDFSVSTPTSYSKKDLKLTGESFSLSLKSYEKAIYLTSIEIEFYVPDGLDFDVSTDENGGTDEPSNPDTEKPETNYKPISVEEYYKDIDINDSSLNLMNNLNAKLNSQFTGISYGDAREILCYTDQIVGDSKHLYSLLDGDKLNAEWDEGATWNREHVWPKSLLNVSSVNNRDINIATDLMNLRASCSNANSAHGNKYYGEKGQANAFYPNITSGLSGTHSYSGDHRGDVARICFYMATMYKDKISLSDNPSGSLQNGYLSALLKWNKDDPVDEFEIQRNNRIYEYQGNRNPFVDLYDNNVADKIFG